MIYVEEMKKQRGWVMRILERTFPDGLDQETIKKQLIELKFTPSEPDIRGIVAYLEGKGYVKVDTVGSYGLERKVVALTTWGKDLLEKTSTDAGVDIG